MRYFEEAVKNGEWDEAENYLSGFTKYDNSSNSTKAFFEIRKQKYLEALHRNDYPRALDILKELKVLLPLNIDVYKELVELLTLEKFRENEHLETYGDTASSKINVFNVLKSLIESNPDFRDKLRFPSLDNLRLQTLINQIPNGQHQHCKYSRPYLDIGTLYVDHARGLLSNAHSPSPVTNLLMNSLQNAPFQPAAAPHLMSLREWVASGSPFPCPAVSMESMDNRVTLKCQRAANHNPTRSCKRAISICSSKRKKHLGSLHEANNLPASYSNQSRAQRLYSSNDLPRISIMSLHQGSAVKAMNFHPVQPILLLVGTNTGDVILWDLRNRERLTLRTFKVWDERRYSSFLQENTCSDDYAASASVSVNCLKWSPDGTLIGVAYSKNIVHLYWYHGGDNMRNNLEIYAHVGSVNDLVFRHQNKQLNIITCGEDKTIKVWDACTGKIKMTFEGHQTPVYSVCPNLKNGIEYILSTAADGMIKLWLYWRLHSIIDYKAPALSCTKMVYSNDGTRLFSCGSNEKGNPFIVEWNETEGKIKTMYNGIGNQSVEAFQFDISKNGIFAAGHDSQIKFWHMDCANLLMTIDAECGTMPSPLVQFNKEGVLLAVSTNDNGVKILANMEGLRMLRISENYPLDALGAVLKVPSVGNHVASSASGTSGGVADQCATRDMVIQIPSVGIHAASSATGTGGGVEGQGASTRDMFRQSGDNQSLEDPKSRITEEGKKKHKIWKMAEVNEPSQCHSLRLPDNLLAIRVSRLIYSGSGVSILALSSNAVHKLWKWQRNDKNPTGKATASVPPQLWLPTRGMVMNNEISYTNSEDTLPCFAISKNNSYVVSASGGKISVFNLVTFKPIATFMAPPPTATCLAFHPDDNNVIAIGLDDSSILIYNIQTDEAKSMLKGHQKRITGLAFSQCLNVLVSSGSDAQLCVWSIYGWKKQASSYLQIPTGQMSTSCAETLVEFHHDQMHVVAVHKTHIGLYEAWKLECLHQWFPCESSNMITHATYSCDSQLIYVSFEDGHIEVLTSTFQPRCWISPTAYLPTNPSLRVYPVAIAAHPIEPNQFALGLTDGGVCVLEPLESEGKWGPKPPLENGTAHLHQALSQLVKRRRYVL